MTDFTVLTNESLVVVKSNAEQHAFNRDNGTLSYDFQESSSDSFPTDEICQRAADAVEEDVTVEDIFPLVFEVYATDDSNTKEMLRLANLPPEPLLVDRLWNHPGEIKIRYRLTHNDGQFNAEPIAMKYEGTWFTPYEREPDTEEPVSDLP
jgi:hypothetical protein